jgi:UDP-glucuronate 4-epimerase
MVPRAGLGAAAAHAIGFRPPWLRLARLSLDKLVADVLLAAMRALVTGSAGFIGFHLARRLLAEGWQVTGLDGMTSYYDVALKEARHAILAAQPGFTAHRVMLEDIDALAGVILAAQPQVIVHLAAQAGVRHSLEHPRAYLEANVTGTFNLLEAARQSPAKHLLIASTSSVYGANTAMPFGESDAADHPMTFYAATKKAAETMSHAYSHLWGLPTTALRFFTVYGPWGRPDMALFKFVDAIDHDRPIELYNRGEMARDFTYIDDLIEALVRLIGVVPELGRPVGGPVDSLSPAAPWRVVNIGSGAPVKLAAFVEAIEKAMGRAAKRDLLPMQPGDVASTFADTRLLEALTGYRPATPLGQGVEAFWAWYRDHYRRLDQGGD